MHIRKCITLLPDGIFQTQNPLTKNFGRLAVEGVGIFMTTLSISWPNCILYDHFVAIWYIFPFWYVVQRKIWQP
jgi:hypothetical protein